VSSAFVAYLEWGTRLAVINSQPGAQVVADLPMPKWGWGEVKGPYTG
jgi:hemoglobin